VYILKSVSNKLTLCFLVISIFLQCIIPFSTNADTSSDTNIIIRKTVKESIESYDKIKDTTEKPFMSGSTPAVSFNNKDYQIFEITFPESGYYSLDIYYGAAALSYKPITAILIQDGSDYVEIARANIEPTGAYSTFGYQTIGYYAFIEGTYKIKVYQPYADIWFSALSLTKKSDVLNVRQNVESYDKTTGGVETVYMSDSTPYVSFNGGDYQLFEIAVSESALYKFDLKIGAKNADYRAITSISIHDGTDYIEQVKRLVDGTGAYSNFENQNFGYYELQAGINKIKIYERYADIWFSGINITKAEDGVEKITKTASDYTTITTTMNDDGTMKMSHSLWATYSLDIQSPGKYMIFVTASNVTNTNVLSVFLNDIELCSERFDKGFNGIYTEYYIGSLNLSEGVNEIKLKHTGTMFTTFSISSLSFVRVGDKSLSVISGDSLLTKRNAYDISNDESVLNEGDCLSFDVDIDDTGIYMVSSDSIKNTGSIGVSINGRIIGIIDDFKNRVFFFEAKPENVNLKIQVLTGEVDFTSLYFNKISATSEDLDNFLSDINSSLNVIELERVFNNWKDILFEDFDDETSELISLTPIYAEMFFSEYNSAAQVVSEFYSYVEREKTEPSIVLYKDNEKITGLTNGNLSLEVCTKYLKNNTTIVAAIYEDNSLYKVAMGNFTGEEHYLTLELNNVIISNNKNYVFKLLYIDNITSLKPIEDFENVYKNFYVSPTGKDENDGSENFPFATLQMALDVASEYTETMTGNIVIHMDQGNYFVDESINLTTVHSGKNGYKVVVKGSNDNQATLNGGKRITGWSLYKNGIYRAQYELNKDVRNLYVNGYPAIRAKSEYAFRCSDFYNENDEVVGITVKDRYFPTEFSRPQDLELVWELVWEAQRTPVSNVIYIDDIAVLYLNSELFARNSSTSSTGFGPDKQFYLENALELLDNPGEFYYNPEDGFVYYYPTQNEDIDNADVYVGVCQGLVSIDGNSLNDKVSNISFENLAFKYSAWENVTENGFVGRQSDCVQDTTNASGYYMIPAQFIVNYADNISVKGCEFSCLGSSAVAYRNGVSDSEIIGNTITDVSGTGIAIGSFEHESNLGLACENITVKNNIIRRAAIEYRSCAGISLYYDTAVEICHNTLMDLPYTAITGGWGWGATGTGRAGSNRICHNYIDNVMCTLSDGGGIYFLGMQKNTIITENYINNVNRRNAALYSDNGSAYIHFYKNLCTNSKRFATASPGGHTNYYTDNYTDTDFIYEEYEKQYGLDKSNFLVIRDNIIIDLLKLPDEAVKIRDAAGVETKYETLLGSTNIPEGKNSIINITPKRTYTNGEIYEVEKIYTSIGSNVGVYSDYLGISSPQGVQFELDITEAGTYEIGVYGATPNSTPAEIDIIVNDEKQASGYVNITGSWTIFTNNDIGEIVFPEGKHTLYIKCTKGSFHIDCFTLNYLG